MSIIGRILHRGSSSAATAVGAAASAVATAPDAAKTSIFGKVGKCIMNNKLNTAFLAMSVVPALMAYNYAYDSNGNEVQGTNWSSGNSAVAKAVAKFAGFTISGGATAAIACGAPLLLGAPIAALGLYLGFCKVPEWLEKLFPDEGEQVKQACAEKGIAYVPPSLMGSFMGGGGGAQEAPEATQGTGQEFMA